MLTIKDLNNIQINEKKQKQRSQENKSNFYQYFITTGNLFLKAKPKKIKNKKIIGFDKLSKEKQKTHMITSCVRGFNRYKLWQTFCKCMAYIGVDMI